MADQTASEIIAALSAQVEKATTVEKSAETLILGIKARIESAVKEALANGATLEQLQPVADLGTALGAETDSLSAAVEANT